MEWTYHELSIILFVDIFHYYKWYCVALVLVALSSFRNFFLNMKTSQKAKCFIGTSSFHIIYQKTTLIYNTTSNTGVYQFYYLLTSSE